MKAINRRVVGWLITGAAAAGGACEALAQAAATGTAEAAAQHVSIADLFEKGGPLLYVLTAMSVIGLAFVFYFAYVLRSEQVVPGLLQRGVVSKLRQGLLADARTECGYRPCAFSAVTVAALDFVEASGKADPALLKEVIEGEGSRQATAIQTQIQYLLDIGVIAPMVGLLGTVFGMVRAFNVVAFDVAKAKPMLLAGGVAEAMINTAGGLIVGIPAMIAYAYFRGRASKLISHLESASVEVLTTLARSKPL